MPQSEKAVALPLGHDPEAYPPLWHHDPRTPYQPTSLVWAAELRMNGSPVKCVKLMCPVPLAGLEPARLTAGDFESPASTIPPQGPLENKAFS